MPRPRRAKPPPVLKVTFLVEREECPELYRWLTKLPNGHLSRLVRERLECSLEIARSGLAQRNLVRSTPPRDLHRESGESAPAVWMSAAAPSRADLAREPDPQAAIVLDPTRILLEMAQNF